MLAARRPNAMFGLVELLTKLKDAQGHWVRSPAFTTMLRRRLRPKNIPGLYSHLTKKNS